MTQIYTDAERFVEMTTTTVEAVYDKGTFHVKTPELLALRDGQSVRLIVEVEESEQQTPLSLLTTIYEDLSEDEIAEIEKIILDRSHFFTENRDAA